MDELSTEKKLSRILAIDYGRKRIGIAISDPMRVFAFPLITIQNSHTLFKDLSKIFEEKEIGEVVLGIPTTEMGEKSILHDEIIRLKEKIEKVFSVQVYLWDESFSSSIATEIIIQTVKKKSKRRDKSLIDKNAAAVILTEYLNSK
jgi:putative Holliday junction resolvase